jgi:hypothetical protein
MPQLKKMYEEGILKNEQSNNKIDSSDERSESNKSD